MGMQIELAEFDGKLLEWWKWNDRHFPWRNTRNPYYIMVSEILLHRTRADQVVPIYEELIRKFCTIKQLANAEVDDVKKILHPLGLSWRNELLHGMAKEVVLKLGGKIPSSTKDLENLPGVSHYISSAVRCFAFGQVEALLDTNTVRILGRLFGISTTNSSRRSSRFKKLYWSLIDIIHPREFNYAMIDLGALICTPRNPKCYICPINRLCCYGSSRRGLMK